MRFFVLCALLTGVFAFSTFGQQLPLIKDQAAVGNRAPDFTMTAMSGKTVKLEDLRGKVVVLNFWSTKCAACAYETPALNDLVDAFAGKDVVFLGFAHDSQSSVEKFLKKQPFKYEIFPASMQAMITGYGKPQANGFYDMPFPLHIVVDQQGKVVYNEVGYDVVDSVRQTVARLLNVPIPAAAASRTKRAE